jgi:hypothetical protein
MTVKTTLAMLGNSVQSMYEDAADLLRITRGCRPDMHEPDEQGVSATVRGRAFDNAGFEFEMRLTLRRTSERGDGSEESTATVNLATLVALARIGAQVLLDAK